MRTALVLAVLVLTGTGGEIAVTHAMKQLGEVHQFSPRAILRVIGRAFRIGWMWFGFGLMAVSFVCLLTLLSWEAVSFVIPTTALSYAVGALGAEIFLGEQVSRTRWAGVLLVCVGVFLVVWGGK
jgi:drug/metabolite transporter (DMT)-like permease